METLDKVIAFITRSAPHGYELLLFRHPSAGIQLPAGTVERGEDLEQAALREAVEETGITGLRLLGKLDTETRDLGRDGYVLNTAIVRSEPHPDAPATGQTFRRGLPVKIVTILEPFAEIVYEEYDFNITPPRIARTVRGWVETAAITSRMIRHYYHLSLSAPTPQTWEHIAEGTLLFRLFWTRLVPKPQGLVAPQAAWLDRVYPQLLAAASRSGEQ